MSSTPVVSEQRQPIPNKILRALAALAIALAGILIFTAISHPARSDYIEYWSSGKLLVQHANPYSPAGVLALEQAHRRPLPDPLIMLNPPWALFLVAPLGLCSVRVGLFFWTILAAGCVAACSKLQFAASKDRGFAFVFAPALSCIVSGQSSPFLLLGFCLFLSFHRSHPFLAGASLLLMTPKPHLFLIFWVLLLVDCVYQKRWLILAGGASALAAATAFSLYFDAHIWQHYFDMLRGYKLQQGFLPTASMLFRMLIDVRVFWLLFVPSGVAILWGLWYYARRKEVWDWRIHGMLLMLVTVLVSPYGFFSDEIVLLPSIAFALTFPRKRRYSAWILLGINSVALYIVFVRHAALSSREYLWTPVTWLIWYLYATGAFERRGGATAADLMSTTEGKTAGA
ncbi:MAG TPA: glycosyltransferase 87 family protein [Silvibacterium sp.]|nr:glycosyltransferase 87 family protein [Silvibacterium sp.]